jgi:hypothetical protein
VGFGLETLQWPAIQNRAHHFKAMQAELPAFPSPLESVFNSCILSPSSNATKPSDI